MHKSRVRLMLVALLGVFAFGAVAAAAAQAEAPFWSIEGHALRLNSHSEPETHYITAKVYVGSHFVLNSPTSALKITCTSLKLKEGVLLGSKEGEAGKNNEVIEFEGCTTSISGCNVTGGKVVTTSIQSELVENVVGGAEGKQLLTEFFPGPTSGGRFATIKLEPKPPCPVTSLAVEGSVAGEVRTDPNESGNLGEVVELGQTNKEATSGLVNFPEKQIKEVWLIKSEKGSAVKVGLKANTEPAELEGTSLVLLAEKNSSGELVTEKTPKKWSSLP